MERSRFSEKSTLVGKLITAFSSYWEYVYLTYSSDRQKRADTRSTVARCTVKFYGVLFPLFFPPPPSLPLFSLYARCTRRKGVKLTHDL